MVIRTPSMEKFAHAAAKLCRAPIVLQMSWIATIAPSVITTSSTFAKVLAMSALREIFPVGTVLGV